MQGAERAAGGGDEEVGRCLGFIKRVCIYDAYVNRMSGHPEIDGKTACEHGRYFDVCKEQPCRGMYGEYCRRQMENATNAAWEQWKIDNAGADPIDAIIFALQQIKSQHTDMKDPISTLIARVRCL